MAINPENKNSIENENTQKRRGFAYVPHSQLMDAKQEVRLKKNLIMRNRVSPITTSKNVFEVFFDNIARGISEFNYMFFGRKGTGEQRNTSYIELAANLDTAKPLNAGNGRIVFGLAVDGVAEIGNLDIWDVRAFGLPAGSTASWIVGTGPNGITALGSATDGQNVIFPFYISGGVLYLGATLQMDQDNAYDIGSTSSRPKTVYTTDLNVSGSNVTMSSLPTSNPGGSGRLWNDSGTIKIT